MPANLMPRSEISAISKPFCVKKNWAKRAQASRRRDSNGLLTKTKWHRWMVVFFQPFCVFSIFRQLINTNNAKKKRQVAEPGICQELLEELFGLVPQFWGPVFPWNDSCLMRTSTNQWKCQLFKQKKHVIFVVNGCGTLVTWVTVVYGGQ